MTNAPVVKVKGIPKDLGGTTYVVPPLSLGALEQLQERLGSYTGDVNNPADVRTTIDAAHAALKRNYPDLKREEVAELIGLENMIEVFEAVMDISGMRRKAYEAASTGSGEAGD